MEFKDRKANNPGRVILEDVQTKARTTANVFFKRIFAVSLDGLNIGKRKFHLFSP